jgi:hypothetical protein
MKKDFLTITPDNGGSQEVTVQAGANYGDARSTTITISGGGYRSNYRCESGSRTFYSV